MNSSGLLFGTNQQRPRWGLLGVLSIVVLNGLLSFSAIWPTAWIQPDLRISPDILALVVLFMCFGLAGIAVPAVLRRVVSSGLVVLLLGHYANVAMPNVMGRPVNLYWDAPQVPRFVWVSAQGLGLGKSAFVAVLVLILVVFIYYFFHRVLRIAEPTLRVAGRKAWCWVLVAILGVVVWQSEVAYQEQIRPWVARPIVPFYATEVSKLIDILVPSRAAKLLPASTVVDQAMAEPKGEALAGLKGRDVMLVFLETYGAVLYDQKDSSEAVAVTRRELEGAITDAGRFAVSAYYRSPTIGGASDLAHLSLLAGIDLTDPRKHDVLLTTQRPTLIKLFQKEGYEVHGLYHSVFWDWVERSYYGFDQYISGTDLGYTGPAFGFWKIPDQYAIARYRQMYPAQSNSTPRLTIFPTISTHFPFNQVPPYQPDWKRLLSDQPFDEEAVRKAQAEPVLWEYMKPDYLRAVNYCHQWLAGLFSQQDPRPTVYVLLGDHQPTGSVSREPTPWDVPVMIVSDDPTVLEPFKALGFTDGWAPQNRKVLGGLDQLTADLLKAWGGR